MAAPAVASPSGRFINIRGNPYRVLLPSVRDPRLHLAAVIFSLQILGQVAFDFKVSIAQILVSLATCAVLEVGIAAWRQHVLLWPASALITGNGVSFILRWHLGSIGSAYLWRVLLTSPEILIFLFFMITDPRTTPRGQRARLGYGIGVGLLAALMIAPLHSEYATKVAILASLTVVCAA